MGSESDLAMRKPDAIIDGPEKFVNYPSQVSSEGIRSFSVVMLDPSTDGISTTFVLLFTKVRRK